MKQLAEHYFEPDQHDPQDIADNDEASGEDSDDDPEVDTLLDHALTFLTQTCSCVCAGLCSFEQAQLAAQRISITSSKLKKSQRSRLLAYLQSSTMLMKPTIRTIVI